MLKILLWGHGTHNSLRLIVSFVSDEQRQRGCHAEIPLIQESTHSFVGHEYSLDLSRFSWKKCGSPLSLVSDWWKRLWIEDWWTGFYKMLRIGGPGSTVPDWRTGFHKMWTGLPDWWKQMVQLTYIRKQKADW